MPLPKDPIKAEEWRRKHRECQIGTHHTKETINKMVASHTGKIHSDESRKKISDALKGNKNGLGYHHSEEARKKIGDSERGEKHHLFGKHQPKTVRIKLHESHIGDKNYNWRGGISFEPYCIKFNNEFRERVRSFFRYCCVECGASQTKKALSVHHVNFNKKTCCDSSTPLFVALCHSCHSKTNNNRLFWEIWFTEMINYHYGGKCYFTKEEMAVIRNN